MRPYDANPDCRGLPENWDDMEFLDQEFYGFQFDTHNPKNFERSPKCSWCPTCGHENDPETCWYNWAGHALAWRCFYCGTMVPEIDQLRAQIERLTKERDEARGMAQHWRNFNATSASEFKLPWEGK